MENRVVDLESRISFQEEAIDALTQNQLELQQGLQRLERQLVRLTSLIQELAHSASPVESGNDPPPPHY